MKKILALDQGEYLGGAERFFSDLLRRVAGEFELHLITGKNAEYHQLYAQASLTLHALDLPALKPLGWRTFKAYRKAQQKIAALIEQLQPDLILSNTVRTHLLVSKLAQKKGLPLIWMAHDLTFPKPFLRYLKTCPQKIISCSKFVQAYYQRTLDSKDKIDYQVLYPFALEEGQLDGHREISKEKVIGMVGKFIPWKGQDLFLKMAHRIHQTHPEYRFELISSVYENNPESQDFYRHCQNLIKDLKLEKGVALKTAVDDIFAELARWELLVHCSLEPEPLGRVVLEGMASGCAVVASSLGGVQEVVQGGKTGWIVEPKLEPLVKTVEWILKHPEEKEEVTRRAQKKVKTHYSWPQVLERFKMILNETENLTHPSS